MATVAVVVQLDLLANLEILAATVAQLLIVGLYAVQILAIDALILVHQRIHVELHPIDGIVYMRNVQTVRMNVTLIVQRWCRQLRVVIRR